LIASGNIEEIPMPTIVIKLGQERAEGYINELHKLDPDLEIREWPEVGDPADVDIAMVWKMPYGELAKFPNLKLIMSMAAGVDHVLSDPKIPRGIPLVRVTDAHMARSMSHWVAMNILRLHREAAHYDGLRQGREWPPERAFDTDAIQVGILGLGYLGSHVARMLQAMGLKVQGWSRTAKQLDGIPSFQGADGLRKMAESTNFLVCLLPNTPATVGVMNAALFALMPRGSYVLNAGRGAQLVEADLTAALNAGQIAGAALDVFTVEPLPEAHSFWDDGRIIMTPHHAAEVYVPAVAATFLDNIRRCREGRPLQGLVNLEAGY
jgi:glyoxylate/hydroxypyruvate reductase A